MKQPDFCGRTGFPDYALQNNNANIRRIKQRIEELSRSGRPWIPKRQVKGVQVIEDAGENPDVAWCFPASRLWTCARICARMASSGHRRAWPGCASSTTARAMPRSACWTRCRRSDGPRPADGQERAGIGTVRCRLDSSGGLAKHSCNAVGADGFAKQSSSCLPRCRRVWDSRCMPSEGSTVLGRSRVRCAGLRSVRRLR